MSLLLVTLMTGCNKQQSGVSFNEQDKVSASGHIHTYYLEYRSASTCKEEGKEVKKCSCGETTTELLPKAEHKFKETIDKKPTCTLVGKKTRKCTYCGYTENVDIEANGHKYESIRTEKATCSKSGTITKICRICKNETSEVIPKVDHVYVENKIAPTCTEDGRVEKKCIICSDTEVLEISKATGHDYQVTAKKEATCSDFGQEEMICSKCKDFQTEIIPVREHEFTLDYLPAGCEYDGYRRMACTWCGAISEEEILTAIGHDYRTIAILPPTCSKVGQIDKRCTHCGNEIFEETAFGEHDFETIIVEATCISDGYIAEKCKDCGQTNYSNIIPTTGHDYTITTSYPASCTQTGFVEKVCTRCNDKATESIPLLPHNIYEQIVQNATCQQDGIVNRICSSCNSLIETININRLEHDYRLTIDTDEMQEYECVNCGSTKTEMKPKY